MTTRTDRSAPRGRTGQRRAELLAIAAELFAAKGFANVTVDDIGDAAGVSGPALYHHFDGKEALLGEMLVNISRDLLDGAIALRDRADDATELLDGLIRFHCEFAVDNRALITVHFRDLVHASAAHEQHVRRLQARYASIWALAVVERHAATGRPVRQPTARAAVHATFGLINSTPFARGLPRALHVDLLARMATAALTGVA